MDEGKAILTRIAWQPFPVNKKQLDKAEYFKYFGSLKQKMPEIKPRAVMQQAASNKKTISASILGLNLTEKITEC